MSDKSIVQIQRGRFGVDFQFTRAMLSAASALAYSDSKGAVKCINEAIATLHKVRSILEG